MSSLLSVAGRDHGNQGPSNRSQYLRVNILPSSLPLDTGVAYILVAKDSGIGSLTEGKHNVIFSLRFDTDVHLGSKGLVYIAKSKHDNFLLSS